MADRPPSDPWRVYGSAPKAVSFGSQRSAYKQVAGIVQLGARATVYHFENGLWVLYERVEPKEQR